MLQKQAFSFKPKKKQLNTDLKLKLPLKNTATHVSYFGILIDNKFNCILITLF